MVEEATMVDLREKGRSSEGGILYSERRLYMQLLAFGGCLDAKSLETALSEFGHPSVLYADLNDPRGVGLLLMHEDPSFFPEEARGFLSKGPFADLAFKPEYAMFGRSYSIGYERDLEEVLIRRPMSRALDPALSWATWYPLRRKKSFESLPEAERHEVMMDHGGIGRRFGSQGLAYDIRLACHGLDRNDNDFVVGILSDQLVAVSAVVQAMRGSRQTMHHLDSLGPFFTGKAIARIRV